ncbi:acyltransferase [Chryseobacterium sp. PBS4-4]|uniref:Acyltransferase n=1 Tax=Chryseobacterium edaphi TaxID=2976532 RepID=A0ABT2W6H7_9FLAO|nr:acyltransferase [Chryseobacterium edaphi]MCU7617823.1 acyltransferase [Chryseobacterium edaphi]
MKSILGFIFLKLRNFSDSCIADKKKSLFFTKKSNIHSSFKIGKDNHFDISSDAEFVIGSGVEINQSNYVTVKSNAKLTIGENTYITRATISCLGEIEIGKNCILGEGMKIFDHNHQYTKDPFTVSKTNFNIGKVKLGNNVWTGANVIILKDVTIGDNVILGAGCVIHKDVPSNSIIINQQNHQIKPIQ